MAKLLVDNAWVIPVDGRRNSIERGAVAVDGDRIVAVGPRDEVARTFAADVTLDATGKTGMSRFRQRFLEFGLVPSIQKLT